jgi:hypothetical protein
VIWSYKKFPDLYPENEDEFFSSSFLMESHLRMLSKGKPPGKGNW